MQIKILNSIIERKIPAVIYLASCGIYIHFFTYLFAARQSVKKYEVAASNQYSEAQKITLGWLKTIIYFFLALMLVSAVNSYLSFQSLGRLISLY